MMIVNSMKSITRKDIENVENRLGIIFPVDYKEFLLKYNGGSPTPNTFTFVDEHNKISNSIIDFFHSIYDGYGIDNLETKYEYFKSSRRIPSNILPIASDPFGNFVCISVNGEDTGAVYFWNHECEPQNASYENLFLITRSFKEFLSILK